MINEKAFRFPFKDTDWASKFLIGSLLILGSYVIPFIPMLFVFGYIVRSMRHAIKTGEGRLPSWEDWLDLAVKGVLYVLVYFIYLLPGLVVLFGSLASLGLSVAIGGSPSGQEMWAIPMGMNALGKLLLILGIAALVVAILVLLIGLAMAPIAVARLAATEELSAALDVKRVWAIIRAQFDNFLLVWAVSLGLGYLTSMAYGLLYYTICCCIFVPFVAAPISLYLLVFSTTLFAQVYRQGEGLTSSEPLLLPDRTESAAQSRPEANHQETSEIAREAAAAPAPRQVDSASSVPEEQKEAMILAEVAMPPLSSETEEAETPGRGVSSYERTINELGISSRVERVLLENGFVTIGQVLRSLEYNEAELLEIKGFGAKALEELKTQLRAKGFLN